MDKETTCKTEYDDIDYEKLRNRTESFVWDDELKKLAKKVGDIIRRNEELERLEASRKY